MREVTPANTVDLCGKCGSSFLTLIPDGTKCFDCGHIVRPLVKTKRPRVDVGVTPSPCRADCWYVSLNVGPYSLSTTAYSEEEVESIVSYIRGVVR